MRNRLQYPKSGFAVYLMAALLLVLPVTAQGASFDDALIAYQKGNYQTAFRIYKGLAEQGNPRAQNNLANLYDTGQGVARDLKQAAHWYSKAAMQGHLIAQYNLGNMYDYGLGVPQDYAQAHMWLNLAASKFPPGKDRDSAVKNRDIVAKNMTPAQISEAQKLAREWRPKK